MNDDSNLNKCLSNWLALIKQCKCLAIVFLSSRIYN